MNRATLFYYLAALVFALPAVVHAAGFSCAKAASVTEKAICADSSLSQMDKELAAAWAKARAKSASPTALATQRRWIIQRDACGSDVACIERRYQRRLTELKNSSAGDHLRSDTAQRFQQTWKLDLPNDSAGSELTISGTSPLHFSLQAFNGGNTGALEGDATRVSKTQALFEKRGCRLDFVLHASQLVVDEKETSIDGGCGAGAGVRYDGNYVTTTAHAEKPAPNLHSLGVVSTAAEDAAVRRLLGSDYPTLISTVNAQTTDAAAGTTITTLWVRGLANTNAAIVMNRGGRDFWIGLLVFAAHDQLRARYYTTVVQDKKAPPKPIRDWLDQIDKTIPIDMMP